MYSVFDIAEWFLHKEKMTHKKLQKLCYYAYAWNYTLKGTQLFNNTKFQAWVHGPVSPELYRKYAGNGWNELSPSAIKPFIDKTTEEVLNSVWDTYGDLTGNSLEALTHSEPPWIKMRFGLRSDQASDRELNDEDVKLYYSSIYEGGEE